MSPRLSRALSRRIVPVAVLLAIGVFLVPLVVSAAQLKLPKGVSESQAAVMYGEQLESQRNIVQLVEGDIASFTVKGRKVKGDSAELKLSVEQRNGLVQRGVMRMFSADGKWFFKSISREKEDDPQPASDYDVGVLNTILAEQVAHSNLTAKLVDGTYTKIEIGEPEDGYRAIELPVTFSGKPGLAKVVGRMTCVEERQRGQSTWFITGFSQ